MLRSILTFLLLCFLFETALAQKNNKLDFKYGDSIQLVTNDSFWYQGIFIKQTDSTLMLQKLYADNFYVLKKNVVFIKVNNGSMERVIHQDSSFVTKRRINYELNDTTPSDVMNYRDKPRRFNNKSNEAFREINESESDANQDLDYGDLYTGNYFFSGSAIQLPKNEGYYKATYLLFHSINYSLTDYLSIGAGTEFFTMLLGSPFGMLQTKLTTQLDENIYVGVKYNFFTPLSSTRIINPSHIVTGMFTWGSPQVNVSANFGGVLGNSVLPTAAISGYYETDYNFALITENVIAPIVDDEYLSLFSFGVRWINLRNVIWEAALYTNIDLIQAGVIPVLPYIGAQFRF